MVNAAEVELSANAFGVCAGVKPGPNEDLALLSAVNISDHPNADDCGCFLALEASDASLSRTVGLAPADSTWLRSLRMSMRVMPITCASVSSLST